MPLKQLAPSEMTADDLRDWCSVLNDMTAADMPAEPRWRTDRLSDYLTGSLPDDRRFLFMDRDADGDRPLALPASRPGPRRDPDGHRGRPSTSRR